MEIVCHGIRFDPDGVRALLEPDEPDDGEQSDGASVVKGRRGAKRKSWWDDLWIEMIRRIQNGTLNPKSPADLQRTLENFVTHDLNGEYGDSTLKPMAAKLFEYLEKIGRK